MVWDLETVPDLAAAARMLDLPKATDAKCERPSAMASQSTRCIKSLALVPWWQAVRPRVGAWTRSPLRTWAIAQRRG